MAIDGSIYFQGTRDDGADKIMKGIQVGDMFKQRKLEGEKLNLEKQKQMAELAQKNQEREIDFIARNAPMIKDQQSFNAAKSSASKLGLDTTRWGDVYDPDLIKTAYASAITVKDQLGQKNEDRQFGYTKEKDDRQFGYNQQKDNRDFGLQKQRFNLDATDKNRTYDLSLAKEGLSREMFEADKNYKNQGMSLKEKELALMERDKSALQKYREAKLLEAQNKAQGKDPAQDKALLKKQGEFASRYGNIQAEADKLKKLVDEDGTAELFGDHENKLKQAIDSIAIDAAKMFDPESVARESEVAAFRKMLFEPGSSTTLDSTAIGTVDNFQKMVQERAMREAEASGNTGFAERLAKNTPLRQEGAGSSGLINEAQAAGGGSFDRILKAAPQMQGADLEAFKWASQNTQDPRAQGILQNLNNKYGGR